MGGVFVYNRMSSHENTFSFNNFIMNIDLKQTCNMERTICKEKPMPDLFTLKQSPSQAITIAFQSCTRCCWVVGIEVDDGVCLDGHYNYTP